MVLELDPIYYTETMVKILQEQGHSQHAMELAETILKEKGPNENVARILEELKTEARRAFERFKNSGRVGDKDIQEPSPAESAPAELIEEDREMVHLSLVKDRKESGEKKIQILSQLLERIQKRRSHEVRQA